jgi:protein TonB
MATTPDGRYSDTRRRPKPWLIALIVLLHIVGLYGLARIFSPEAVADVERSVLEAFTVTVATRDYTPEADDPQPDEGAAGEQGRKAVPKPVTAPDMPIPMPKKTPVPKASSTGSENRSGARDSGEGTGASGAGDGTGSGRSGGGMGNGIAAKPSVRSGNLDQARDFPVPEGGRQARFGKSVTVVFTVTTDGRAKNCSVASTQVDAETTALVCPLVVQKIRFNPATRADGTPVEARYGYRVDFNGR